MALVVTGIVSPAALLVMWVAQPLGLSPAHVTAVAVIAGAFAPPITVLTRTMWRHRFESDADRKTAFALDAVLIELAFTAGPALIALLLAVGSPAIAFGAPFFFTLLAVPTFLASPALRYWKRELHGERHLLGPLREGRLVTVYATTFLITASLGLLEIGYPGFAAQAGSAPLAGVLLAVNSVGSAVGGLAFGALHWRLAPPRQLPRISRPDGAAARLAGDDRPRGRAWARRVLRGTLHRARADRRDDARLDLRARALRHRGVHVGDYLHRRRHRRRQRARRPAARAIRRFHRFRRVRHGGAARGRLCASAHSPASASSVTSRACCAALVIG
jgi:hypothetical protein